MSDINVVRPLSVLLLTIALTSPGALFAQQRARSDTTRLNTIVVTADGARSVIGSSVSAVTRVSGAELAKMPQVTLADVLRMAPGFNVVNQDGLGYNPQIMGRGFYGAGEAEYVVVLVDGKPVNQLHTGLVAWDALPPVASIEAVEIVRGSGSSLYGDVAVAGVINVLTRGARVPATTDLRLDAAGGSHGTFHAGAVVSDPSLWSGTTVSGGVDRTDGFREHSRRTTGRASATAGLFENATGKLGVTLASNWRAYDDPGPLLESLLAANHRASDALFRFDHTYDRAHTVALDGSHDTEKMRLTGSVRGEYRSVDQIRTFALAPGFGDTKERDAITTRSGISLQTEINDSPLPGHDRLILGAEANHGTLDSKYYKFLTGRRPSYLAAQGTRGALDTDGSARRDAVAVYADYSVRPLARLRFSLGGRVDQLRDAFDPTVPAGDKSATTTHSAFSPKSGLNYQYQNSNGRTGNAYVAVSRTFKAPSMDQLYDQHRFPVPFPPYQISTSNPSLVPRQGVSMEGGLYQSVDLASDARLTASITGYQMDMTNELDFDSKAYRYVNIGRSQHRGVEASVNAEGPRSSAFVAYTLQAPTSKSGSTYGKRLKAIPQHTLNAGLTAAPYSFLDASLIATHARDIYLDDANTVTMPNYTRVDLRVSLRAAGRSVFADVRNVLDARYTTTGFLDPAGSAQAYLYPAAGRIVEIGLRSGF